MLSFARLLAALPLVIYGANAVNRLRLSIAQAYRFSASLRLRTLALHSACTIGHVARYTPSSSRQINSKIALKTLPSYFFYDCLKGVTRYTSKMIGKLENEIIPSAKKKGLDILAVCCNYDTDVFHTSTQPIVDWVRVQREVKRLKIRKLELIPVDASIEDWLLEDLVGIFKYLNLQLVAECKGKNGADKLMGIFKKANKVYIKGSACQDLIMALDIARIRKVRFRALQELEQLLNVTL